MGWGDLISIKMEAEGKGCFHFSCGVPRLPCGRHLSRQGEAGPRPSEFALSSRKGIRAGIGSASADPPWFHKPVFLTRDSTLFLPWTIPESPLCLSLPSFAPRGNIHALLWNGHCEVLGSTKPPTQLLRATDPKAAIQGPVLGRALWGGVQKNATLSSKGLNTLERMGTETHM